MTRFLRLLLVAVVAASTTAAAAQTAGGDRLVVPELQDADLDLWIGKSNTAVKLLNATLRAKDSYSRYGSWVDLKQGPTGKERIVYGLYSVSASQAADAITAVRRAIGEPPAIPSHDEAALELAAAFEALVPIVNEAQGYYERQDYKDDKMAGGRALHARLMPAFAAFLAARDRLEARHRDLKDGIDGQQLARIERTEGRSYRWHQRRALRAAEKAVDKVPRDPRKVDLPGFEQAIADYAGLVKEFDAFVLAEGKSGVADSQPRSLLGKLRELRDKLASRRIDPNFYSFDVNAIVSEYNLMINFANSPRR